MLETTEIIYLLLLVRRKNYTKVFAFALKIWLLIEGAAVRLGWFFRRAATIWLPIKIITSVVVAVMAQLKIHRIRKLKCCTEIWDVFYHLYLF